MDFVRNELRCSIASRSGTVGVKNWLCYKPNQIPSAPAYRKQQSAADQANMAVVPLDISLLAGAGAMSTVVIANGTTQLFPLVA